MHSVMTRLHTLLLTFHGLFLAKKNALTLPQESRITVALYKRLTLPLECNLHLACHFF